jgi:hypothetical protein
MGDIMANTEIQHKVENWVRVNFLGRKYNCSFIEKNVPLIWGGVFKFDAVSENGKIVASISTSGAYTASGKPGIGKRHKLLADTLFLLNVKDVAKIMLIFTEKNMRDQFEEERKRGRFPHNIDLIVVDLPVQLRASLMESRQKASQEVAPRG